MTASAPLPDDRTNPTPHSGAHLTMIPQEEIDRAYALIEAAAIKGERCPMNFYNGGTLDNRALPALCRAGRIRVEISGKNFRRIFILGIADARIEWRRRHPCVVGTVEGKPIKYGFASTPSDWRAERNLRLALQRIARQAS